MTRRSIGVSSVHQESANYDSRVFPARSPSRRIPIPVPRLLQNAARRSRREMRLISARRVPGQATSVSSATKEASARRVRPPLPPPPPAEASRAESTCGAVRDIYDREHARASARLRTPCGFDNVTRVYVCTRPYVYMHVGAYVPVAAFPMVASAARPERDHRRDDAPGPATYSFPATSRECGRITPVRASERTRVRDSNITGVPHRRVSARERADDAPAPDALAATHHDPRAVASRKLTARYRGTTGASDDDDEDDDTAGILAASP